MDTETATRTYPYIPAGTSAEHIRVLYSLDRSRSRITLHGAFGGDSIAYQCARSMHQDASTLTFPPGSRDGASLLGLEVRINLRHVNDPERETLREEQVAILAVHLGL